MEWTDRASTDKQETRGDAHGKTKVYLTRQVDTQDTESKKRKTKRMSSCLENLSVLLESFPLEMASDETHECIFGSNTESLSKDPCQQSFDHEFFNGDEFLNLLSCFENASVEKVDCSKVVEAINSIPSPSKSDQIRPHQKMLCVIFDRIRSGCHSSMKLYLSWTLLPHAETFGVVQPFITSAIIGFMRPSSYTKWKQSDGETTDLAEVHTSVVQLLSSLQSLINFDKMSKNCKFHLASVSVDVVAGWNKFESKCEEMIEAVQSIICKIAETCTIVLEKKEMVASTFKSLIPMLLLTRESLDNVVLNKKVLESQKIALKIVLSLSEAHGIEDEILALLTHMCKEIPSRSAYRTAAVSAIFKLAEELPESKVNIFLSFLFKLSKSSKVAHRLVAVETASYIKSNETQDWGGLTSLESKDDVSGEMDDSNSDDENGEGHQNDQIEVLKPINFPLLRIVVGRSFKDRSSMVRSLALKGLNSILLSCVEGKRCEMINMIIDVLIEGKNDFDASKKFRFFENMVRRNLNNEKTHIRSATVDLLESLGGHDQIDFIDDLAYLCEDNSVLVRKHAIKILHEQYSAEWKTCDQTKFRWMQVVFGGVQDDNASVQNFCASAVKDNLINYMLQVAVDKDMHAEIESVNKLLNLNPNSLSLLKKTVQILDKNDGLTKKICKSVSDSINMFGVNNQSMLNTCLWTMYEEIVKNERSKSNMNLLMKFWRTIASSSNPNPSVASSLLQIIANDANELQAHDRKKFLDSLLLNVLELSSNPQFVSSMLQCLYSVYSKDTDSSEWSEKIVDACDKCITAWMSNNVAGQSSTDQVIVALYSVGQLVLLGLQYETDNAKVEERIKKKNNGPHIPSILTTRIQALITNELSTSILSKNGMGSGSQPSTIKIPLQVRAHAFVTLGKLCCQDYALAKSCINVFIRELDTTQEPILRNNILLVLGDLCRQFTGLIDAYIPNMAACLQDSQTFIRRHTLLLLTELLLENFIKFRGPLLFRFLLRLCDENEEIRQLAHQAIFDIFAKRDESLISSNFVECMFAFNDYQQHSAYNQQRKNEGCICQQVKGDQGRAMRFKIYKSMLSTMSDENKFNVHARIISDILGGIIDGDIPIPSQINSLARTPGMLNKDHMDCPFVHLFKDCFTILSSKALRIASSSNADEDDAKDLFENAKKKMLTKMTRKNLMQNAIPILIALKQRFEKMKSSLLREVNDYFQYLFRSHRSEVDEALREDPRLAQEVEYDLRQFEQNMSRQKKRRRQTLSTPFTTKVSTPLQSRKLLSSCSAPRLRNSENLQNESLESISKKLTSILPDNDSGSNENKDTVNERKQGEVVQKKRLRRSHSNTEIEEDSLLSIPFN